MPPNSSDGFSNCFFAFSASFTVIHSYSSKFKFLFLLTFSVLFVHKLFVFLTKFYYNEKKIDWQGKIYQNFTK